jgi:hypothetical protein
MQRQRFAGIFSVRRIMVRTRGGGGRCGGGRRGFRNWFHATGVPGYGRFRNDRVSEAADEAIELRNQAQYLKTELERINSRLSTIENGERGE